MTLFFITPVSPKHRQADYISKCTKREHHKITKLQTHIGLYMNI